VISTVLVGLAIVALALYVVIHERRVFLLNRNSSRPVVEAQKKGPPAEADGREDVT
jgi:hypothetical protein